LRKLTPSLVAAACAVGLAVAGGLAAATSVRVAMVLPGPINDRGFNQTGYDGLKQCGALGLKTAYSEKTPVPQYVRTYTTLARQNDVVIGHGFEFGDIAKRVAPQFPDVKFIVTSNPLKPPAKNIEHLMANSVQGAFLAGAAAGMATKSNKLGGIFGFKFPVLAAQAAAFEAGARYVNPKITFKAVYLGTFDDVAKGKEAAQSLADSGVDVIYHIADAAGVGVINGAQAAGVKVVGWGIDQNSLAPKTVIASQIVDQARQIKLACADLKAGRFEGGQVKVDGLRDGVVGLSRLYNMPASAKARIAKVRAAILSGKAKVPSVGGGIPGSGPKAG
jgi:basic membrane protein A